MGTRRGLQVIFRLGPHIDKASARTRLDGATRDLSRLQLPADPHGSYGEQKVLAPFDRVSLQPFWTNLVASRQRASFGVFFLAALGLLLLACFNTAGLIAARNIERRGQLLICRTLGATTWHLVITKGSALEIPRKHRERMELSAPDFKGRALGYEIEGAPNVPV